MADGPLWVVLAGVLCLEGVLPLVAPASWKRLISTALLAGAPQLRWLGGFFAACGCALVLLELPFVLTLAGGLLIVEGLPMLLAPAAWAGLMRSGLALRDGQLRFIGLLGVGAGVVVALLAGVV